jgi:hypothetical protein
MRLGKRGLFCWYGFKFKYCQDQDAQDRRMYRMDWVSVVYFAGIVFCVNIVRNRILRIGGCIG